MFSATTLGASSSQFCGGRRISSSPPGFRVRGVFGGRQTGAPLVCPVLAAAIGYGKKWEKLPVHKKTGKVIKQKLHVQTGDHVVVIAGADKGKTGDIAKVDTKYGMVWIEGVNMKTRYTKPASEEESGTMQEKEGPIHFSNVMHYSKAESVRSRVGKKVVDGKKVRYLKKTGEILKSQKAESSE